MTQQLDEILGLLGLAPKAPGELASFTEPTALDMPAQSEPFRDERMLTGPARRMAVHDSLPEEWRLLVHEHGLKRVVDEWNKQRVRKDVEKARQAIEVAKLLRYMRQGNEL